MTQRNRNGKYDSIQYGHEKHMENLQIPHPILDENGVALGGKKASIQFAYNMRHGMFLILFFVSTFLQNSQSITIHRQSF